MLAPKVLDPSLPVPLVCDGSAARKTAHAQHRPQGHPVPRARGRPNRKDHRQARLRHRPGQNGSLARWICPTVGALLFTALLPHCKSSPAPPQAHVDECIDFEDLPVNAQLTSPFTTHGSTVSFAPLTASSANRVTVDDKRSAGTSSAQELFLNGSKVKFSFAPPHPGLTFNYGDLGGSVFLSINNNQWQGDDMTGAPPQLGSVHVRVQVSSASEHTGRVTLEGDVASLEVGGEELAVDYFCSVASVAIPTVNKIPGEE